LAEKLANQRLKLRKSADMSGARQHGFTLVEILVTLAVLAIALSAFLRVIAQTIDATLSLRDHSVALWVAQNKMAENFLLADWPDTGSTDGEEEMGGQKWFWQQEISKTNSPHLRNIDISVRREPKDGKDGKDGQVVARLISFVRDPKTASYPPLP
jgi:general secretion pathway protein I